MWNTESRIQSTKSEQTFFFHFGGTSLRRVHVFLRHLEKTYHLFFEPEMGVLALFSKKGQKGQKKFSNRGKKKNFLGQKDQKRYF